MLLVFSFFCSIINIVISSLYSICDTSLVLIKRTWEESEGLVPLAEAASADSESGRQAPGRPEVTPGESVPAVPVPAEPEMAEEGAVATPAVSAPAEPEMAEEGAVSDSADSNKAEYANSPNLTPSESESESVSVSSRSESAFGGKTLGEAYKECENQIEELLDGIGAIKGLEEDSIDTGIMDGFNLNDVVDRTRDSIKRREDTLTTIENAYVDHDEDSPVKRVAIEKIGEANAELIRLPVEDPAIPLIIKEIDTWIKIGKLDIHGTSSITDGRPVGERPSSDINYSSDESDSVSDSGSDGTNSRPDGTNSIPDGTNSRPDGTNSIPDGTHSSSNDSNPPSSHSRVLYEDDNKSLFNLEDDSLDGNPYKLVEENKSLLNIKDGFLDNLKILEESNESLLNLNEDFLDNLKILEEYQENLPNLNDDSLDKPPVLEEFNESLPNLEADTLDDNEDILVEDKFLQVSEYLTSEAVIGLGELGVWCMLVIFGLVLFYSSFLYFRKKK